MNLMSQPSAQQPAFQVIGGGGGGQPTIAAAGGILPPGFQIATAAPSQPSQAIIRPPGFAAMAPGTAVPVNQAFGQQLVTLPGGQQAIVRCAVPQMVQVRKLELRFDDRC